MTSRLHACKVYISEGRRRGLINVLKGTVAHVRIADVFEDAPYNRSNFTLVSCSPTELAAAATRLTATALDLLDLRQHEASHPRLGVVDHISCQPVGPDASLQEAADIGRAIGRALGTHQSNPVPVFLYGAAHPEHRTLADIRRQLGYFSGSQQGRWAAHQQQSAAAQLVPEYGPAEAQPCSGVIAIGASPWVTNLNVPLATGDLAACRAIAKRLSARGGGMPHVEAMALPHTSCVEIACNLLDTSVSPVAAVIETVQQLAAASGLKLGEAAYVLGTTREQLLAHE